MHFSCSIAAKYLIALSLPNVQFVKVRQVVVIVFIIVAALLINNVRFDIILVLFIVVFWKKKINVRAHNNSNSNYCTILGSNKSASYFWGSASGMLA